MTFINFTSGNGHSFGGEYLELVPGERLRYTDRFDDPNLPGEMTVTITLKPVLCGTDLTAVQEGIPEAIPTEMCYLGWQESLEPTCASGGAGDTGVRAEGPHHGGHKKEEHFQPFMEAVGTCLLGMGTISGTIVPSIVPSCPGN